MPLIKSASAKAFGENVARERHAGRPLKQSVAIAYATQRAAEHAGESSKGKRASGTSTQGGILHHSAHSQHRSDHYHSQIVEATKVRPSSMKMTRAEHQLNNPEDFEERGHE